MQITDEMVMRVQRALDDEGYFVDRLHLTAALHASLGEYIVDPPVTQPRPEEI